MKSIDDVRSLVAAARGLAGLVDLGTLTSRACRHLRDLVGCDATVIAVYRKPDQLEIAATEGLPMPAEEACSRHGHGLGRLAFDLDDTPCVRLHETGPRLEDTPTVQLGQDLVARLHGDPVLELAASAGLGRVMACPVEFGGAPLGVLYIGRRGDTPIGLRDAELVWEFAASLAPLMVTALTAQRAGEVAAQEERARIAQQLHDTAGQMLFAISLAARDLRQTADVHGGVDTQTLVDSAKRIEYEAAQASVCLRNAMHTLLPAGEALPVSLRRDVATFSRRSGVPAEVIVLGTPTDTSDIVDETVLGAVREGLHNVERHAAASSVSVTLTYRPLDLALLVQDDGVGLHELPPITPLPGKAPGLGIPGLRQRVRALGGDLSLCNGEDGGASLLITCPLAAA
ncbi:sensor histidine kinase [Pseudonocardia sp.]|uniref:sensor histidine kinase n=1 Tax=Pseudonocardia sp. TaxID=60912 RepID=UPI003D117070